MSIGRVFHNEAAAVSIKRLLYFTVLFLLGVDSVSFTDRSCLLGNTGSLNSVLVCILEHHHVKI